MDYPEDRLIRTEELFVPGWDDPIYEMHGEDVYGWFGFMIYPSEARA